MNTKEIKIILWIDRNWINYNQSYKSLIHVLQSFVKKKVHPEFYLQIQQIEENWSKEKVLNYVNECYCNMSGNFELNHHIVPISISKKIILEIVLHNIKTYKNQLFEIFEVQSDEDFITTFSSNSLRRLSNDRLKIFNTPLSRMLYFLNTTITVNKNIETVLENLDFFKTIEVLTLLNFELSETYFFHLEKFGSLFHEYKDIKIHDNSPYNNFKLKKDIFKKKQLLEIINIFANTCEEKLTSKELDLLKIHNCYTCESLLQNEEVFLKQNNFTKPKFDQLLKKIKSLQNYNQY